MKRQVQRAQSEQQLMGDSQTISPLVLVWTPTESWWVAVCALLSLLVIDPVCKCFELSGAADGEPPAETAGP
jgi:hypothetical protein